MLHQRKGGNSTRKKNGEQDQGTEMGEEKPWEEGLVEDGVASEKLGRGWLQKIWGDGEGGGEGILGFGN
jgi:hypothetical protein